jgi:hypothetical protein
LLYYDAFQSHELNLYAENSVAEAERFFGYFFDQLILENQIDSQQREKEHSSSKPRQPLKQLDVSLRDALERFKVVLPSMLFDNAGALMQGLLPEIESKVADISCRKCTPFERICEGVSDAEDDEIVTARGMCVVQLREMFDIASEVARAYYSTHGTLFPAGKPPEIVFSTVQFMTEVGAHNSAADRYASGLTNYFSTLARAQVQLHLYVRMFDLETYKSVLYLLFHECIAHAFHATHPDPKERETAKPYERFTEGWMDWVAYKILEEVVKGTGDEGQRWKNRITLPNVFEVSTTLHRSRSEGGNHVEGASQIRLGVRVAEVTFDFFKELAQRKVFKDVGESWRAFLRLSFDLNMLGQIDAKQRNAFVGLMRHLEFPAQQDEMRYPLEALLLDYLRTQDIHTLVEEVNKLAQAR